MKSFYKNLILLTLILTSFTLGVFSSDYIRKIVVKNIIESNNVGTLDKNSDSILRSNIFTDKLEEVGILQKENLDLKNFWEIYSIIKKDYYDIEGIKKQDLIDGASKGLVNALGDKHSEFFSKKDNEEFEKMLSGDFEGIGAVVDKLDFGVKIERVLKGSPAEKYGLLKDDIIIEANGEKLEKLSLFDAVAKIKGPAGTKVLLKILRAGEKEALEIKVTRGKIKIPSVEEKYFEEDKIGYITLNMFGQETASEFKKALKNIKNKNANGLIIDLRNNGGGYLISAVEILSEFVEKGELLVTTKYKNTLHNEIYPSLNYDGIFDKKIVILINGSSASASEITAGALREYNKAILVGEKTYGKGSVQKPFNLDDGSMVKLTIAKWFTPKDKNIDGEGIEADIEVKIKKEDYDLEECKKVGKCDENLEQKDFEIYDRQLEEAKNILKSFIKKGTLQVVIDEENKRLGNKVEEENIEEKK